MIIQDVHPPVLDCTCSACQTVGFPPKRTSPFVLPFAAYTQESRHRLACSCKLCQEVVRTSNRAFVSGKNSKRSHNPYTIRSTVDSENIAAHKNIDFPSHLSLPHVQIISHTRPKSFTDDTLPQADACQQSDGEKSRSSFRSGLKSLLRLGSDARTKLVR